MTDDTHLDALRREIDDVDDRIHDLLMARADIARSVGASKRAQAGQAGVQLFRPAREARVLRRLLARHRGSLPRSVVQDVWRAIISGNLLLQGRMSVVATPGGPSGLARDHFGSLVELCEEADPAAALAAVSDRRAAVAVLPFPGTGQDAEFPWWGSLMQHPELHIVGEIPVLRAPSAPTAALVAGQRPEASDADVSLILTPPADLPSGPDAPRILATLSHAEEPLQMLAVDGFVRTLPAWAAPGARIAGAVAAGID